MTASDEPRTGTGPAVVFHPRRDSWWIGRGDLAVGIPALVAAGLLLAGTATMHVRGESEPGPQFFPVIVVILLVITGGWLTIGALLPRRARPEVWHRPDVSEDMLADLSGTNTEVIQLEASRRRPRTGEAAQGTGDDAVDAQPAFDWRTFGLVLAAVVVFAVILEPVGWILSATLLFWVVAYALGSRRPLFDIGVGLLLASLVQIAFSAGLGLALPSGLIGWIL